MMTPGSPTATGGTPTPTFGRCSWGRTSSSPSRGGNWSSGSGRASSSPSWTARGNGASRSRSWGDERRAAGAGPTGKGTQVTLTAIARKVERGERLSPADGVVLLREADLSLLRTLASLVRYRKHPAPEVTYVVGRNLSYTNVCWVQCKFCAFYRLPGEEGAWTITREEILGKVQELTALGGTELLFLAKISGLSLAATLERLKRAGLDSIPGGGAEILVDAVRQEISPLKDTAEEWLACLRTAP